MAIFDQFIEILPEAYQRYFSYTPIFLLAFAITFFLTPIIGQIAKSLSITDKSKANRLKINKHDDPTRHLNPRNPMLLGGIAVLIPVVALTFMLLGVNQLTVMICGAIILIAIGGVLDDTYNLPGSYQLIIQLIAASMIVLSPIEFDFIKTPFFGSISLNWQTYNFNLAGSQYEIVIPAAMLVILWIGFTINAIKAVGGSDALLESNMVVTFFLLFVIGVRNGNELGTVMSIVLAGSLLAFTFYNFPPAKIFSGSSGKTAYGFLAITLALVNQAKLVTTILLLLFPIIDFLFVIISRYIKHRPRNPLMLLRYNDTSHFHHQLMKLNLTPKQILTIESSITLMIGSLAILTTGAYHLFIIVLGGAVGLAIITVLHLYVKAREDKPQEPPKPPSVRDDSPESRYSY